MSTITTRPDITVEPFTIEFDCEDNHCSRGPDLALEDVDQEVAKTLLAKAGDKVDDDDHLRDVILDHVKELEEQLRASQDDDEVERLDALVESLKEAAAHLWYCEGGCDCVTWAFESWSECLEDQLDELGDHHWAVLEPAAREPQDLPQHDIEGTLDYESLARVMALDSWSRLTVKWTGEELTIDATGRDGCADARFVPLTQQMRDIADRWDEYAGYDDCRLGRILNLDLDALLVTLDLMGVLDKKCEDYTLDFDETVAAFTALTVDARRQVDPVIVAGLVDEGAWEGTPTQLLNCVLAATAA